MSNMIDLRHGDCLEVLKTIPDKSIDLVVTDPPYEIITQGGGFYGSNGKEYRSKTDIITGGNVRQDTMKDIKNIGYGIDLEVLQNLCRVMKKINIYIWCSQKQLVPLIKYFTEEKKCNWNLLTWHKTNPIPACGNKYLSDTEYCLFFREKGVKVYGEFKTKFTYYVTPLNTKDKKIYKHPTIKPLDIIENLIINSSLENDIVLDCFMGSGTTGVACKNLNRNFIGIELDKNYFEIANVRINNTSAVFDDLD